MPTAPSSRTELLRRQGTLESAFALAVAVSLFAGDPSPVVALGVGLLAVWLAARGHAMIAQCAPLAEAERHELERLKRRSQPVRELVAVIERAGQSPVRFDLNRCRRLARVESLLDGRT